MGTSYSGKNGISIKLIIEKINAELKRQNPKIGKRRDTKASFKSGTFKAQDWKMISIGLRILEKTLTEAFEVQNNQFLEGQKDVSNLRKEVVGYRHVMEDFVRRLEIVASDEAYIQQQIESLTDYSQIAQAARDGVIIKQEKRKEIIDGEEKEIIYDTSMTPGEVINLLEEYDKQEYRIRDKKLGNLLGLGMGLAGIVGTMSKESKISECKGKGRFIGLGTAAVAGLKLIQGMQQNTQIDSAIDLRRQRRRKSDELIFNEQVSGRAEVDEIDSIGKLAKAERRLVNKIENKRLLFNVSIDLVIAIISGIYINNQVQIKENGKIDGKSLASALVSLQASKGIAGNLTWAIQGIQNNRKDEQEFRKLCQEVQKILLQMEEKVYPLEGAKSAFDSMQIKDFKGQFYPKKNYETGEDVFSMQLNIPEFSMKRGDVVLLSGESGSGKSTFLRLLKRGDINNRKCITLDDDQLVDNLGDEYISFRPSINLGNESNVLSQLTGKESVSELNENERKNLIKILNELDLNFPNLLEHLASKKFMEFSTGQQRRLALSKLFYRIDDGTSVIIVDEPVGNVEDRLIREQLQMIKKYAKDKNVMLLLTTHRLDLAEDLATKRYHINSQGVMEQIPIKNKESEKSR